ncbi:helix-turn-helix domain-containing protein [Streptomyces sp. NPDC001691]|uniref:helix-turn-helix domain-containing protein n=1 Tax=unclassified Streptomyces TaxID=2593676 RepID=UPI001676D9FE|nr:helix-turn-helix domain-containing protein [Streptomyces sp. SDr-06]
MSSADLLLHPVRLRIVQAFLNDRALTTNDLRDELSDVAPTTLYRHVSRLVAGGVLTVEAERRVRGTVERTYVLRMSAASLGLDHIQAMTAEDHRQAFTAYVAGLLGDFDRYLARGDVDLLRDQVGYSLAAMWLDDAEFAELRRELARVLAPRLANPPAPGRTRRIYARVLLPGDNGSGEHRTPPSETDAPAS